MNPAVELVSTGAELLSGRTVNAHAQTLARHLADLGLPLLRDTTVPDDRAAIREALAGALDRVPLVIVSGGLGPTSDDVTRDAVADVVGRSIVMHEPTRDSIRERYARTNRIWSESVARHALVLEGADVLPNRAGLAPGECITWRDRSIFLLPGPPPEFEAVLEDHVVPNLRARAGAPPLQQLFQVTGIGESDIIRILPEPEFPGPGVAVAYCARPGRIEIRLTAPAGADEALARAAALARERMGDRIYAESRVDLETVVVAALRERERTVAVAESCTGGLVGHLLTNVAGSSTAFLGGVLAYSNAAKVRDLGVSPDDLARHGAVSAEVAREMADGVRVRFGSDYGIGVTGIAGPDGGTDRKPVGLVFVAVSWSGGGSVREFRFAGPRAIIKQLGAQAALDQLRMALAAGG